jgi:hypothetical protein
MGDKANAHLMESVRALGEHQELVKAAPLNPEAFFESADAVEAAARLAHDPGGLPGHDAGATVLRVFTAAQSLEFEPPLDEGQKSLVQARIEEYAEICSRAVKAIS